MEREKARRIDGKQRRKQKRRLRRRLRLVNDVEGPINAEANKETEDKKPTVTIETEDELPQVDENTVATLSEQVWFNFNA